MVGLEAGRGRVFVWEEGETITDQGIVERKETAGPGQPSHSSTSPGAGLLLAFLRGLRPGQAGADRGDGHQITVLVLHRGGGRVVVRLLLVDSQVERLLCLLLLLLDRFGEVVRGLTGLGQSGLSGLSEAGTFTKAEEEAHPGQHGVDGGHTGEHRTRLVRSRTREAGQEN